MGTNEQTDNHTDNLEALQVARAKAIESDCAYSRARLKRELRMRPKSDATPKTRLRNTFGTYCDIYRVADCVPMRQPAKNPAPPTEKQLAARRLFGLSQYKDSTRGRAGARAAGCVDADAVYLDTETTGLDGDDEVIEIAIVDALGRPIIDTRVKPTVPVGDGAYRVHGIGADALRDAPTWPEIAVEVHRLLERRPVVIFNADFDARLLEQTARAAGMPDIRYRSVTCAMDMAAQYFGPTNSYGTISLSNSVDQAGVSQPHPAHSARGDATATAALVRAMARAHREKLASG